MKLLLLDNASLSKGVIFLKIIFFFWKTPGKLLILDPQLCNTYTSNDLCQMYFMNIKQVMQNLFPFTRSSGIKAMW